MNRALLGSLIVLTCSAAEAPKTVVDLQPFRQTTGGLTNLNPAVNRWFVFTSGGNSWHLENPHPRTKIIAKGKGLQFADGKATYDCDVAGELEKGRNSRLIYYPLCGERIYLRNAAKGQRTALESATEFLRTQVWGGEKVIVIFHHLLGDRYRETGESAGDRHSASAAEDGPGAALTKAGYIVKPESLGIAVDTADMAMGAWYRATGAPGIFVSVMQPNYAAVPGSPLDNMESAALCYLVAFDLDRFELGFEIGTAHPAVNWSERVVPQMKDTALPGPDGFGTMAPLVMTGLITPENGRRTAATFTGGFKRDHGAFHWGPLAMTNHGSHYGFIENGVMLSKLQPGLATLYVLNDGSLGMKTWTEGDYQMLANVRHARQNGVSIVEFNDARGITMPNKMVNSWEMGNWSGSEDGRLRTIRAGAALQKNGNRRFLIYAVFSASTPSAMAQIFQAYQCTYAMMLDMNALEHTYCAVYRRSGSDVGVEHLLKGMSVLDKEIGNAVVPRFLGYPDNRDFFYLMRKEGGQ